MSGAGCPLVAAFRRREFRDTESLVQICGDNPFGRLRMSLAEVPGLDEPLKLGDHMRRCRYRECLCRQVISLPRHEWDYMAKNAILLAFFYVGLRRWTDVKTQPTRRSNERLWCCFSQSSLAISPPLSPRTYPKLAIWNKNANLLAGP